MSAHVTRPKLMPVSADPAFRSLNRPAVRVTAVLRSKAMFGKDDLVDNLSRDLDRARGRRDALASEATTLTAQIAEIEARLSEEKTRRERDRVLAEIEAIKKRIKQAAGAFAPVVDGSPRRSSRPRQLCPRLASSIVSSYRWRPKSTACSIPCCANWISARMRCEQGRPYWTSRVRPMRHRPSSRQKTATIACFASRHGCLATRSRKKGKRRRPRAARQRERSARCAPQKLACGYPSRRPPSAGSSG